MASGLEALVDRLVRSTTSLQRPAVLESVPERRGPQGCQWLRRVSTVLLAGCPEFQ